MSREAMTVEEIQHIREWASGQKHDLPKRFMQGDGMWAAIRAVCDEALRAALPETSEPVAWMDPDGVIWRTQQHENEVPLYRYPPADALKTCRAQALEDAALKCDELAAKYLRKQSDAKHVDAVNMFEDRAAAAVICGRAIRAMK